MKATGHIRSTQSKGVLAGIASGLSYGLMSYVIHVHGAALPSTEIVFFRSIVAVILLAPFLRGELHALLSGRSAVLWLRSFFAGISILCFTWNLQHTSIGLANVLFGVSTLAVILLGWWSGTERFSLIRIGCLLMVVLGGALFWRDLHSRATAGIFIVGLGGAVAAAASYTALKRATATWSPVILTWLMSVVSIPVCILLKHGEWTPLNGSMWSPVLGIAILSAAGQIFVTLSFKWADLSIATGLVPSSMVWGVLLDVLLDSAEGVQQLAGCIFFLVGCIPLSLMASAPDQGDQLNELRNSQQEHSA